MTAHSFNIGSIEYLNQTGNDSIEKNIAGEKMYAWIGNVGLINVSDILKASTNPLCISASDQMSQIQNNNSICDSNYLLNFSNQTLYWTINAFSIESSNLAHDVWYAGHDGSWYGIGDRYASGDDYIGTRPVVFLKSNITLSGTGNYDDPYQINKEGSTSTLEKPTYTESGSYGKTVTITYPKGCGDGLTCSYQKDNGEVVNVTNDTVDVEFTDDGNIVATVSDGTNTVSSSYTVTVVRTINDYTKDGLFAFYDGIENTPNGHGTPIDTWYNKALDLNPSVATTVRSTLNGFNTSSWTNDNGLLFDGVDDMVDTGYLQEVLGQKITLSFTVYTTDINNYRGYFGYHEGYEGSPVNRGFDMQFNNNQINFGYFGNSINCGLSISEETINNMIVNKKTNITVILSAQDKIAVYFNGQKIEETSCTNVLEPYTENFIIGQSLPSPERYFKGTMYNFMVYNMLSTGG